MRRFKWYAVMSPTPNSPRLRPKSMIVEADPRARIVHRYLIVFANSDDLAHADAPRHRLNCQHQHRRWGYLAVELAGFAQLFASADAALHPTDKENGRRTKSKCVSLSNKKGQNAKIGLE